MTTSPICRIHRVSLVAHRLRAHMLTARITKLTNMNTPSHGWRMRAHCGLPSTNVSGKNAGWKKPRPLSASSTNAIAVSQWLARWTAV